VVTSTAWSSPPGAAVTGVVVVAPGPAPAPPPPPPL
jgi:hypothetical protein